MSRSRKQIEEIHQIYTFTPKLFPLGLVGGIMKFIILVDPSLIIITIYLVCLTNVWELRKHLKEIMHFHTMTDMVMP